ncbi:MAG: ORF6N domain-containing protein [Bacteroidales bacterium]|nr:ORF6N domain-containing protein [Bacteroidales bacterium]
MNSEQKLETLRQTIIHEATTSQPIENLIFEIRGQQVMLDRDLAMLYGVETKRLNEQVRRNSERFPEDFMFQLTIDEAVLSRSQIATLKEQRGKNIKYLPYAFTENGVAMLSGVLKSPTAVAVNIQIMRAFTTARRFIAANSQIFQRLNSIERHQLETDHRIEEVFQKLEAGQQPQQGIFFDGQIFDAYHFVSNLVREAKSSIVLFDNYIDDTVLTLLDKRDPNVSATIYTRSITPKLALDLQRHNMQYAPVNILEVNKIHDRFLCIDDVVYHIGASLKDLGKKWFAFSKMQIPTELLVRNV